MTTQTKRKYLREGIVACQNILENTDILSESIRTEVEMRLITQLGCSEIEAMSVGTDILYLWAITKECKIELVYYMSIPEDNLQLLADDFVIISDNAPVDLTNPKTLRNLALKSFGNDEISKSLVEKLLSDARVSIQL